MVVVEVEVAVTRVAVAVKVMVDPFDLIVITEYEGKIQKQRNYSALISLIYRAHFAFYNLLS